MPRPGDRPRSSYDQFHIFGIIDADEELEDDDDRDEILEKVELADLVRRYAHADVTARDASAIAKPAVARYLEVRERAGEMRALYDECGRDEEADELELDDAAAYAAWCAGFREELEGEISDAIIAAFAEEVQDEASAGTGTGAGAGARGKRGVAVAQNPAAAPGDGATLADYELTGRQDAGNTFDLDTLEFFDVELDDYIDEVFTPDDVIDPALVKKASARAAAALKQAMAKEYQEEWLGQNGAEVEESDLLPSEAYAAWLSGFISVATGQIARWIEDDARQAQADG